jgi:hypothetical protein
MRRRLCGIARTTITISVVYKYKYLKMRLFTPILACHRSMIEGFFRVNSSRAVSRCYM